MTTASCKTVFLLFSLRLSRSVHSFGALDWVYAHMVSDSTFLAARDSGYGDKCLWRRTLSKPDIVIRIFTKPKTSRVVLGWRISSMLRSSRSSFSSSPDIRRDPPVSSHTVCIPCPKDLKPMNVQLR
ncbi:hypothetical protein BD779DRAFT_832785 [Infundibulicybe gibba]|nr:hypothetical protein BD779DRAFT_832785 [Infundibulicybe gibba]